MVDCLYLYLSLLYIISIRQVKPCLGRKRLRLWFIRVLLVTVEWCAVIGPDLLGLC